MSVRILAVEDDPSFVEVLVTLLTELGSDVSVQVAKSKESALARMQEESFDIILLDLKLPTVDGSLDMDVEHGRAVLHETRELAPGTPILVLTGSPAESFIPNFLEYSEQVDVWGDQSKIPTVRFLRKSALDELQKMLSPTVGAIRAVRDVEIRMPRPGLNLSWEEDRLIRILVRRRGGSSCTLHRISGGLSGASVYRLTIADDRGAPILHAIVKVGPPAMVASEAANYGQHAQRLSEQATPRLLEEVRYGGGRLAAISYSLAEGFTSNLFDIAAADTGRTTRAIVQAAEFLAPWRNGVGELASTIGDVRRRLLPDEKADKLAAKYDLDWITDFENRQVQLRWCPIHGDMHGANVLVDAAGVPILIDYGDMGPGPAALDWVTLELSTIFHVDGCARNSGWPDATACEHWADVDEFTRNCPASEYVKACREAAEASGVGPREIAVCAYAYVLRQLAYDDTDKDTALLLLEAARRFVTDQT